jgi:hypothetical protein
MVTGFLNDQEARGRPVGVAIDRSGALPIADDTGGTVWRVTSAQWPADAWRLPIARVSVFHPPIASLNHDRCVAQYISPHFD